MIDYISGNPMDQHICPNYSTCQIITSDDLVPDYSQKQHYINQFCNTSHESWLKCRRYQTKNELNFCPDYVLPDSDLSFDEILDKFEEQITD